MKGWEDRWTAQQLRKLQSPHPCPLLWGSSISWEGRWLSYPLSWLGFAGGEGLNPSHWLCSVAAEVNGICSA